MKIDTPDFGNPVQKSPPSVNEDQPVTGVYKIRDIPVLNTVDPPSGHSIPSMPNKLPFD